MRGISKRHWDEEGRGSFQLGGGQGLVCSLCHYSEIGSELS